jgi:Tfp pilus assembly protein PilO
MSRFLFIPGLALAAAILFGYVGPTWSGSIAEKKAAIALDDQALAAAAEYHTQESMLTDSESKIDEDQLKRLNAFLPGSVDNVRLILDLNNLAAHAGVSLSGIDITPPSDGNGNSSLGPADQNPLGTVDMNLTVTGSYPAFQTFLAGIERSQRLLDVRDIVVKGSDTGVYDYQMIIRIYWLR